MIALFLAACAGDDGKDDTGAEEPVTLARVQDEVFGPSCAFSTCHASPGASGLVLEDGAAYDAIVDVESADRPGAVLVVPGDPEGSYLLAKMRGDTDITGEPMPLGAGGADPAAIDLVTAWIEAGAPE